MSNEIVRDDNAALPERVYLPSYCCVRICDREAATFESVLTEDALLVYGLCVGHTGLEID